LTSSPPDIIPSVVQAPVEPASTTVQNEQAAVTSALLPRRSAAVAVLTSSPRDIIPSVVQAPVEPASLLTVRVVPLNAASTGLPLDPRDWLEEHVGSWLGGIGLEEHVETFRRHKV